MHPVMPAPGEVPSSFDDGHGDGGGHPHGHQTRSPKLPERLCVAPGRQLIRRRLQSAVSPRTCSATRVAVIVSRRSCLPHGREADVTVNCRTRSPIVLFLSAVVVVVLLGWLRAAGRWRALLLTTGAVLLWSAAGAAPRDRAFPLIDQLTIENARAAHRSGTGLDRYARRRR